MNVIFCRPELTMEDVGDAICFFNECHTILDKYIYNLRTMTDTKFEVFSVSSKRGQECIQKYCDVWNSAVALF